MQLYFYFTKIIVDFLELSLFFVGIYYVLMGFFSFFKKNDMSVRRVKKNKYAVIIPAHNEGNVLGQLIESVKNVDYPEELIDIIVVCDDCTDNTEYVALRAGARVIANKSKCANKSLVLAAAAKQLESENADYDCVLVLDADNTVDREYFIEANKVFASGCAVLQGNVKTKNPNQNWLTGAYSVWHSIETRFGKYGSGNMGLGCKISGTGYCMRFKLFLKTVSGVDCLAEDLEYTMKLALSNIKVKFAKSAVVYDEKPFELKSSLRQRLRWVQGIVNVQGRYGIRLLKAHKITDWLSLYGDFLGVFTFVLFGVISMFSTTSVLYGYDFPYIDLWTSTFGYIALNLYLGIGIAVAFVGLLVDKMINRYTLANVIGFLIYCVTWIPVSVVGLFSHNKKEWYHTEHNGSCG